MQGISEIQNRYCDEDANLMRYIMHSMISYQQFNQFSIESITDDLDVKNLLRQYKINFTDEEIENNNQRMIEEIKRKIKEEKDKCKKYLDDNPPKLIPNELENCEIVQKEQRLVICLGSNLENERFEEHFGYLCSLTAETLKDEIENSPECDLYHQRYPIGQYEKLLEYCKVDYFNAHLGNVKRHECEMDEYMTLYSVLDIKSPLCIFRQSFILLMTAFDAAIFDIAEIIITEHFFEFCKKNEELLSNQYKLKEIINEGSFEKFQSKMVGSILKNNRVAALLRLLHQYRKDYFILEEIDIYQEICEIVARRNVHVHKRGIVDHDYCEHAKSFVGNLRPGDMAYIGGKYYKEKSDKLKALIINICKIESIG